MLLWRKSQHLRRKRNISSKSSLQKKTITAGTVGSPLVTQKRNVQQQTLHVTTVTYQVIMKSNQPTPFQDKKPKGNNTAVNAGAHKLLN